MTEDTKRHSGHVLAEIEVLAKEYEKLIRDEVKEVDDKTLLSLATHQASKWSGGFSIHNYSEQVVRQTALEGLRH